MAYPDVLEEVFALRKTVYAALAAALLLTACQGLAWSAVTVTWTDASGPRSQDLMWVNILPSDPLYAGEPYAWFGLLDIYMDHWSMMDFTFTGDYTGDDQTSYPLVLLQQRVHNQTQNNWTDFHIRVYQSDGAEFGYVQGRVNAWDVLMLSMQEYKFQMSDGGGPVYPGQIFEDGIYIYDDFEDSTADFTLTKWYTPIPEAGSAAVLLSGLVGMAAYLKRRKA